MNYSYPKFAVLYSICEPISDMSDGGLMTLNLHKAVATTNIMMEIILIKYIYCAFYLKLMNVLKKYN